MFFRKLVRNPTVQNIHLYRKTLGHRIRDNIEKITNKVHPFVKLFFPNFIAFHYFYIISSAILCSILIYPVRNFAYIDILFLATGAATQGGLNTVDLNRLSLYQQIVLYITTLLASPIFIHSGLAFVRFYWFERCFDGIRDWSKRDFEMRRTMTLRQRELTKNNTSENISKSGTRPLGFLTRTFTRGDRDNNNFQVKLFRGEMVNREEDSNTKAGLEDGRPTLPSDEIPERFLSRRKSTDINPADMYRSIAMLQNRHDTSESIKGPALIIKSPAERDKEIEEEQKLRKERELHGQSIQFQVEPRPIKSPRPNLDESKFKRSFGSRKRPSFFKGAHSARLIRNKLKRKGKTSPALDIDEEEGHDADMEGSSDDNDTMAVSSDEETQSAYSVDRPSASSEHSPRSSSQSQPSSLNSISVNEDEDTIGDLGGLSYYGQGSFDNNRNRLRKTMSTNYLSYDPQIGRNSTFVGLSESQKVELGGVEYRSTKLLCLLLTVYYVGFNILSMVVFAAWIQPKQKFSEIIREGGVSPTWWGFWTGMSAFTDLGLTLTPNSMSSFNKSVYPLVWMMWFIIVGNTGFPILLRFIIWVLFKLSPDLSLRRDSLGFLLDHPRRCFTMLFPKAATWWLFLILVGLNVIDLILFIILDINATVIESLSGGYKVLDGLFQAVSTRTAGFTVLDLGLLHPAVQVSYMLMMYVSVMPLAISIRRTNVYEEQSLGIYGNTENPDADKSESSTKTFIGAHLRRQLSFDLWYMFLGLFVICICEGGKIQDPTKPDFTVFQVLFEVVSAYGTVGLSLGYPGTNQSFSAQFTTISKLVIIAMLIRGRHRGLPYTLDRAIILPSAKLKENDLLHEMTNARRSTLASSGRQSTTGNASEGAPDTTSEGLNDSTTDRVKKRARTVWRGISSAFSMGHQPRPHRTMTNRTFAESATHSLSHSASERNLDEFSSHPNNSFPMTDLHRGYTFDESSMQDRRPTLLKESYSMEPTFVPGTRLTGLHEHSAPAIDHVSSIDNDVSNSNSNSKKTGSSSSDPALQKDPSSPSVSLP